MKQLSIVIPLYNAEKYLRPCLDSIVKQTNDSVEVICVNDGSKDNTLDILEDYSKRYSCIVILNQENAGSAMARNNGFKHATGKYLWLVDGDDYISQDAIQTVIDELEKSDADSIIFGFEIISENGKLIKAYKPEYADIDTIYSGFDAYLYNKIPSYPWNRAFKRSFLTDNNLTFHKVRPDDEEFDFRTYACAKKIKFINKCMYSYRTIFGSDSRNPQSFLRYVDGYLDIMEQHLEYSQTHPNNQFWCKISFNNFKNINIKVATAIIAGCKDYDMKLFYAKEKKILDKIIKAYPSNCNYYQILNMIRYHPCLFYRLIYYTYKIKHL